MYNKKELQKKFKNTIFKFGFENVEDPEKPYIAFGHGWGQKYLYMILITSTQIKYAFSDAFDSYNDVSKTVRYRENFHIPKTTKEFIDFISKST